MGLCITACATEAAEPIAAGVDIHLAGKSRLYSPMLYGGFLEHFHRQIYGGIYEPGSRLADAQGFRRDVIEAVRALRVPVVRWPGGCFVSAYHWKEGIGPNRQPSFDKAWGVEDPNTFGTDEFMAWCKLVGCEPYICGNAGTGTPEEMSDWVEYCNQTGGRWARLRAANGHPEPYGVRYWSVGNENWGGHEIGAKSREEWGPFVRETSKMIRRVDPNVVLSAAALDDGWNRSLLSAAGPQLNLISIHGYWDGLWSDDRPSDFATCMMRAGGPEEAIAAVERLLAAAGYAGRVGIAFDEWNLRGWHHPGVMTGFGPEQIKARDRNDINATYTMADALFSASFLNACLRHADTVKMANIAPLINTRGPLYVHPGGLVKRTAYHVLEAYANQLGPRVASASVTSDPFAHGGATVPAVDAVATCDAARAAWRLALINRHASAPALCRIAFDGQPVTGVLRATVLDGDSPDAYNDVDRPDRVAPRRVELAVQDGAVTLPPHSLTIVELTRAPSPEPPLANAGFEADADWRPTQWGEGAYQATWTADRPHAGTHCAQLVSAAGADCAWTQRAEVQPNARYRLSGWIRCQDVVADTGRGAFLNVQEVQGPTTPPLTGTHDWTRVEVEFDTGALTSVQINCLLGGWGRSRGTCWFDDVVLERVEAK
ncbi:MAG: alpha-N-arabinofuranosidase [Armatimonadetes bacterium]|nr:alpha-N-arabinofuranosidase [Armatimonadota bacterium]